MFVALSSEAQTPFKLGTTYPFSWIVEYPANTKTYWQAQKALVAKAYPPESTLWKRYYYPTPSPAPVASYARQSAFDSLLNRTKALETVNTTLSTRVSVFEKYLPLIDGVLNDVKTIKKDTASLLLKISQYGAPLFRIAKDGSIVARSMTVGEGIGYTYNDSTVNFYKK